MEDRATKLCITRLCYNNSVIRRKGGASAISPWLGRGVWGTEDSEEGVRKEGGLSLRSVKDDKGGRRTAYWGRIRHFQNLTTEIKAYAGHSQAERELIDIWEPMLTVPLSEKRMWSACRRKKATGYAYGMHEFRRGPNERSIADNTFQGKECAKAKGKHYGVTATFKRRGVHLVCAD